MRIRIEEDVSNDEELEVTIHCQSINEEVEALIQLLETQEESIPVLPLSLRVLPFSEMVQSGRQDDFDPLYPTLSQKLLFLI
ncbi:hypothetical protein [Carnobacterium maltaromaticum]|uniref:hypothetical protein n=1 Tax=Carnobacterium maltaromaticum TaxID=2751 RepID=UPI0039AEBE0E